jgi:precorrin-6A/cobalt-precorrin-6A reductase
MKKLLIFAGTTEGRELAGAAEKLGFDVTASVATEYGESFLAGEDGVHVHAGRMDPGQMTAFLKSCGFSLVVDATHPYAVEASKNIAAACEAANVRKIRLLRRESGRSGLYFDTLAEAAEAAGKQPGNILAATGSKEIGLYKMVPDFAARVWARVLPTEDSIQKCLAAGLPRGHVLTGRGPFSVEENLRDLALCKASALVTKDGGAAGGFPEKAEAAKTAGAVLYVVRRPRETGADYDEVFRILKEEAACG